MDYQALYVTLYAEVNFIGIIFAALILFHTHTKASVVGQTSLRYFRWMLVSNILTLLWDVGILQMRGQTTAAAFTVTHIFCVLFFLSQCVFGYLWLRYCIEVLYPEQSLSRFRRCILLLPALIDAVISVASPWTGWIYRLSADNRYARGPLINCGLIILYSYWAVSFILLIRARVYKGKGKETLFYRALLLFPLPVIVGNVLQMKFYGLSIGWICTVFSLALIFLNVQTSDGSMDGLTGLWTRTASVANLDKRLKNSKQAVYAMMIDIDNFKSINDQYGHLLGDKALICTANLLTGAFRKGDFVCRYGGDEFLITGEVNSAGQIDGLRARLDEALEALNREKTLPFPLSLSIGVAVKEKYSEMSTERLIGEADQEMYRNKQSKKQMPMQERRASTLQ